MPSILPIIQWGSVADAFAALGAFITAAVAIWLAGREVRRARKESTVEQARRVSVWPLGHTPRSYIVVNNASNEPIYDVVISYGVAYGVGMAYQKGNENQIFLLRVPPGKYRTGSAPHPGGGMNAQLSLSVSFRDSDGNFWRRDATGRLQQTKQHPFRELDIDEPISEWLHPEPYELVYADAG